MNDFAGRRCRSALFALLTAPALFLSGCSGCDDPLQSLPDPTPPIADVTPTGDDDANTNDPGQPGEEPGPGDTPAAGGRLRFPQAIASAFLANPNVFPVIPVRLTLDGAAAPWALPFLELTVAGTEHDVAYEEESGTFVARVDISGLADGEYAATASIDDGSDIITTVATLVVARQGAQLSDFNVVGPNLTPRIHHVGDKLFATYTDWSTGDRQAWLRPLDGGGRFLGDGIALTQKSNEDPIYARCAIGDGLVGILFQEPGGPYKNRFKVTDLDGHTRFGPIDLDPPGLYGSAGGDIVFHDGGFLFVWRSNAGDGGTGQILWARVDTIAFEVTGPIRVSATGDSAVQGPFTALPGFLSIAAHGQTSTVGFLQKRYDASLDFEIERARIYAISVDGNVQTGGIVGAETAWVWDHEARVFGLNDGFFSAVSSVSLLDPDPNAPTQIFGRRASEAGALMGGAALGATAINAPGIRSELTISDARPAGRWLTAAWLDQRSKEEDILYGRIELMVGRIFNDAVVVEDVIFDHPRFIQSTSELRAVTAGTNTVLSWTDARHGSGLLDPRPEHWLETVWW